MRCIAELHEQHTHAERHKEVTVTATSGRATVKLDIRLDEDDPYAEPSAFDPSGDARAPAQSQRG